jgi:hypothetical protein
MSYIEYAEDLIQFYTGGVCAPQRRYTVRLSPNDASGVAREWWCEWRCEWRGSGAGVAREWRYVVASLNSSSVADMNIFFLLISSSSTFI